MGTIVNGTVVSESDDTHMVAGNHYLPPDTVDRELLTASRLQTLCFWKGLAYYYRVAVGERAHRKAAW